MVELISFIIFLFSLIGILVIAYRKVPRLVKLPEASGTSFNWQRFLIRTSGQIKRVPPFKEFSFELFLQKMLSKFRVLTLKTDNQTSSLLQKLRERSQKKKFDDGDDYWKEIKRKIK